MRKITEAARRWIGTPYMHQQRMIGVGCDCVNLVIAVGLELGMLDWTPERFDRFKGYTRAPNPTKMGEALAIFLEPAPAGAALQEGDILWISWRKGLPMHLAIVGTHEGRLTMIHAFSDARAVVEHTLDGVWHHRINSVWRFRA